MEQLLGFLSTYPVALLVMSALGLAVVVAQGIVLITPTKKDDEWVAGAMKNSLVKGLVEFVKSFAPFQKGKKGLELSAKNLER